MDEDKERKKGAFKVIKLLGLRGANCVHVNPQELDPVMASTSWEGFQFDIGDTL